MLLGDIKDNTPILNIGLCYSGTIEERHSCCTLDFPCTVGQGNCRVDEECEGDLLCGLGNCGKSFSLYENCCTGVIIELRKKI